MKYTLEEVVVKKIGLNINF